VRPRLLDLFCGAGGCSKGYYDAGFEVVGVDIEDHLNYPYEFHRGDAFEVGRRLLGTQWFDAIHASPPCPAYSTLGSRYDRTAHPDLVAPTRELLKASRLPYVIENVPGAPLLNPIQLCGSSFGLDVRRHRLFESNIPLMAMPCAHHLQTEPKYDVYEKGRWFKSPIVKVYGFGGGKAMEHWPEAMGIDWMNPRQLANAIPPAYTEFIGEQLLASLGDLPEVQDAR
jgi:DNA (cytosine-5)-methyltransferase 1